MDHRKERGESRLGTLVALLVVGSLVYAGFHAGPAYVAHYLLKDQMAEVARAPRSVTPDEKVLDRLDVYLRKEELSDYITRSNFRINTVEGKRTISVSYERVVKYLPGVERNELFEATVEQTLLF